MENTENKQVPEEGPHGVDRWTSNGYGLIVDGIEVPSPEEKEASHGDKAQKYEADER